MLLLSEDVGTVFILPVTRVRLFVPPYSWTVTVAFWRGSPHLSSLLSSSCVIPPVIHLCHVLLSLLPPCVSILALVSAKVQRYDNKLLDQIDCL